MQEKCLEPEKNTFQKCGASKFVGPRSAVMSEQNASILRLSLRFIEKLSLYWYRRVWVDNL